MILAPVRFSALILAMLIYALVGSPTPDTPSWPELMIAILLCIACLPGLFHSIANSNKFYTTSLIALTLGLSLPTIIGLTSNAPIHDIARDIIAFLFLFLPLFTIDLFQQDSRHKPFIAVAIFIAICFSVRSLIGHDLPFPLNLLNTQASLLEPTYLANSPLILFSAALGYLGIFSRNPILIKILSACVVVACVLAMAFSLQRATLLSLAITIVLTHIMFIKRSTTAGTLVIAILITALIWLLPYFQPFWDIASSLQEKTQLHGLNKRAEEWSAMLDSLTSSPLSILLGQGWGAGFYSPATDGAYVTFTHGLISALLFKTGILGLLVITSYLLNYYTSIRQIWCNNSISALAIALPLLISLTLYGAYKSLDYGILLTLAMLPFFRGEHVAKPSDPIVRTEKSL